MTQPTSPAVWIDGDLLMEAIAAAVWEQCHTEPSSTVVDDPRNIAAVAAAVARQILGTTEQQPAEPEAHPAEHTWAAELHDPLADEWVPGTRYVLRERAVNHLKHATSIGPTWKDGTPTQRRLVRATTTYTVEPTP
ncbi:hypothetical protein [Streptomyces sp. NBC_00046]|uniref:hypothetical protein n=1 Tax=Streptomyces sp. NBC_00046 TaxID=2975626 RepID=UPI00324CA9DF